MERNIEPGQCEALNCRRQIEFVFSDPIQEIEWLALLEVRRQLEAMNCIGEPGDEAGPAGRVHAGQTLDA